MKTLQLTKFYPPVRGGIESVVYELTEGLNARGIATDVLCADRSGRTRTDTFPAGYRVRRVGSWGRLLSTSIAPAMLPHLARDARGVDIVHVHLPDPLTNLALWWRPPAARLVVHWHSDVVAQQRALKLYAPLQEWLLRRADAIVATSAAYADSSPWLRPHMDRVTVIPIGIRDPATAVDAKAVGAVRARHGGRRIVLALGRMTGYKGFDVLAEAARQLPEDCVVVVGGSGELLQSHRANVERLGLAGRVVFAGHIADAELPAHYAAASLFCLPSTTRAEAFGVVLLEAMAMSRPVVATDIPGSGVAWVNEHGVTGLNVPPGDARALGAAIAALLADPARCAGYARNARERYLRHFTAQEMVGQTEGLYRRLLDAPRRAPR